MKLEEIPILYLEDLKDVEWFDDPSRYIYLRQATSSTTLSKKRLKIYLHRNYNRFIGIKYGEENSFGIIDYTFYYLKDYDSPNHPDHLCVNAYCKHGLVPTEAVKILGDYRRFLVDKSNERFSNKIVLVKKSYSFARQRHAVFVRDNYRCVECGATNKDTILHVDHIHPKSKGGSNELSNLQTLCILCNLGKSDTIWEKRNETNN